MVMHWTNDEDVRLLLNILKIHEIKLDYAALATATGPDVTAVAVKRHIQKLKEKAEKGDVNPAGATSADDTTPKSSPKKSSKTPRKAAGPNLPTSAAKPSAMKGTKRNADSYAKESGDSQEGAVREEKGLKVDTMTRGKRIKLINGQFQVDEDDEE